MTAEAADAAARSVGCSLGTRTPHARRGQDSEPPCMGLARADQPARFHARLSWPPIGPRCEHATITLSSADPGSGLSAATCTVALLLPVSASAA